MVNYQLSESVINCLSPREQLRPSDWLYKYAYIPETISANRHGYLKLQNNFKEIVDTLWTEPDCRIRVIRSAARMGKTTAVIGIALFNSFALEQNVLIILNDNPTAEAVLRQIRTIIEQSPALAPKLSIKKQHNKAMQIILNNGVHIKVGTSGSSNIFRYFTGGCCIMDEVDAYPQEIRDEGSPLELAEIRVVNAGHKANVWICSTPTTEFGHISKEYDKSFSAEWQVPCPSCGKYNGLDISQVYVPSVSGREMTDRELDLTNDIQWRCPDCKNLINEKPFRGIRECGKYIERKGQEHKSHRIRGYHVSGMMSIENSLKQIMLKYRAAIDNADLRVFTNTTLGSPYSNIAFNHTLNQYKGLINPDLHAIDHLQNKTFGDIPDESMIVNAGIDCGYNSETKEYCYWVVGIALCPGNKLCVCYADYIENEDILLEILRTTKFRTKSGRQLGFNTVWIDSGHEAEDHVYKLSKRTGLYAIKGDGYATHEIYRATKSTTGGIPLGLIHKQKSIQRFNDLLNFNQISFVSDLIPALYQHLLTWVWDIQIKRWVEVKLGSKDDLFDSLRYTCVSFMDHKCYYNQFRTWDEYILKYPEAAKLTPLIVDTEKPPEKSEAPIRRDISPSRNRSSARNWI